MKEETPSQNDLIKQNGNSQVKIHEQKSAKLKNPEVLALFDFLPSGERTTKKKIQIIPNNRIT